jgi:hypothetical protein
VTARAAAGFGPTSAPERTDVERKGMTRIVRRMSAGILFAATAALAGCDVLTASGGPSEVRLRNVSDVEMTGVTVTTGPGDASVVTAARIAPGGTTSFVRVASVFGGVNTSATIDGKRYDMLLIEGFSPGFNARQPDGRYTVELRFTPPYGVDARVVAED